LARELPKYAYEEFRAVTPIRTGNARSKTDLQGNEIQGNYPYVNRLNKGWSKQAPEGMTDPTIEKLRAKVRNI
jgi:hypothetical protein